MSVTVSDGLSVDRVAGLVEDTSVLSHNVYNVTELGLVKLKLNKLTMSFNGLGVGLHVLESFVHVNIEYK